MKTKEDEELFSKINEFIDLNIGEEEEIPTIPKKKREIIFMRYKQLFKDFELEDGRSNQEYRSLFMDDEFYTSLASELFREKKQIDDDDVRAMIKLRLDFTRIMVNDKQTANDHYECMFSHLRMVENGVLPHYVYEYIRQYNACFRSPWSTEPHPHNTMYRGNCQRYQEADRTYSTEERVRAMLIAEIEDEQERQQKAAEMLQELEGERYLDIEW